MPTTPEAGRPPAAQVAEELASAAAAQETDLRARLGDPLPASAKPTGPNPTPKKKEG